MKVAVAVVLGLVTAACGGAVTAPTSTLEQTGSPPATIGPATTALDARRPVPCDPAPPAVFAPLCDSYRLVMDHYYRPLDAAALAAAALAGVVAADPPPGTGGPFVCALPAEPFDAVCSEIESRVRGSGVSDSALVEAAVDGIFRYGLDPFSSYVPPDAVGLVDLDTPGRIRSLGIVVALRGADGVVCAVADDDCRLEVVAVDEFGPGDTAGLTVGDVIGGIDGVGVDGHTLVDAVRRLDGPVGSAVEIEVVRATHGLSKTLVRSYVPTAYVEWDLVGDDTAWIHLADFSQTAAQALGEVLSSEELAGVDRILLDLRGNPGGLLPAAQGVLSQFLGVGTAFVLGDTAGTREVPVLLGGLATDVRLVVLVDRGTASAAEIVAAALQETGRALVVGERTFGKDAIQEVFRLRHGGEARISVATWTTAGGLSVGVTGLVPDVAVAADPEGSTDPVFEEGLRRLGR